MIRGEVSFETNLVDDKVLLKADGCLLTIWLLWLMIT